MNNNFNFDCASSNEINLIKNINKLMNTKNNKIANNKITNIGNNNPDIIFANPMKWISDINLSKESNVNFYTLDSLEELYKLNKYHPYSNYLLRLNVNDSFSKCRLNEKFGMHDNILQTFFDNYKDCNPSFDGFSFHVGSNCLSHIPYEESLKKIEYIMSKFDLYNIKTVDIGGGFIKDYNILQKVSDIIKDFSMKYPYIKLIGEPGRLMVNDVFQLVVEVIGCDSDRVFINNSIYGDLNCILFDHRDITFDIIKKKDKYDMDNIEHMSNKKLKDLYNDSYVIKWEEIVSYNNIDSKEIRIYGSTCDSIDFIKKIKLPKFIKFNKPILEVGDKIVIRDMGAYTMSARSTFNGIPTAYVLEI